MRIDRQSWGARSWEQPQHRREADLSGGAFVGFVVALLVLSACMWGAVTILEAQGAIGWVLEWWQAIVLSLICITVNALFQAAKVKR